MVADTSMAVQPNKSTQLIIVLQILGHAVEVVADPCLDQKRIQQSRNVKSWAFAAV